MRTRRWVALLEGAVVSLLLVVAGGSLIPTQAAAEPSGGSTLPSTSDSISVEATGDYGFQPDTFEQVPPNATIAVTFTDGSDLPHTFTIIGREGWVIPSSFTPSQIDNLGYGDTPPALFNENVSGSGDVANQSFESPPAGWYEFVCTVPGHFQNGMFGFIAFGENLPSNLTSPTRVGIGGAPIGPLQVTVAGAILLAGILVYVLGQRRRGRERRPPPAR